MMQKEVCYSSAGQVHIHFPLQSIHVVSFSYNDGVIYCFVSRSKDIFTV